MEHRFGERLQAGLAVLVRGPQGLTMVGQIRDISSSGALLNSTVCPSVGSRIIVRFESRERDVHPEVDVVAEVVREALAGFAVEWQELSPPAVRTVLRQLAVREAARRRATEHTQAVSEAPF